MLYLSAAITLFFILVLGSFSKLYNKYIFLLLSLSNLLILGVYCFFNYLSGNGFNEAILFHLIHGINGFGVNEYVLPGLILFFYFLSCIAITLFLHNRIYIDAKNNLVSDIIILFITCLALLLNPLLKDIKSIFFSSPTDSYSEINDFYNNFF